jgi:glycine dehydrogenase
MPLSDSLPAADAFAGRHIGPSPAEVAGMLAELGVASLAELIDQTVPASIRTATPLGVGPALTEARALATMRAWAGQNVARRALLGAGYHDTITPPVILRNVLENPGWYTQYTPYQAEISQGRLEALLIYQTMVQDLTGLPVANASLLDEATAAAEAMQMAHRLTRERGVETFLVADNCHPQTIQVVRTRAEPMGIEVLVVDPAAWDGRPVFGALLQYPATDGQIWNDRDFVARVHAQGGLVAFATDLLALTLLAPPSDFGADIAVGSAQRFGVPLGFGGPHAAFFACRDEYKRQMPGRLVGVSVDAAGRPALRLALGTREQHIRREKATSNICTAQVLLAIISAFYAVWHGPEGLTAIARRAHRLAVALSDGLTAAGFTVGSEPFFDTVRVAGAAAVLPRAKEAGYLLRDLGDGAVGISVDETTTEADVAALLRLFDGTTPAAATDRLGPFARSGTFLTHAHFHAHRSETEMLRFITRLMNKDLSLTQSMIPLGSCTMKLNATTEMIPVTLAGFGGLHPFAPAEDAVGYRALFAQLEGWLADITGFAATSLQPNAGSQGEYAGLLAIRAWHRARGHVHRDVCLIPQSAHGTNPASAAMAGMEVVVVKCDGAGNIDLSDLRARATEFRDRLAALMVTYPSTHGVFEEGIRDACATVHENGGQVYMDGANLNALVGLARPGELGADVCHINLHKTFCIPHGGGGPGMGPICCGAHLAPFLPGHPAARVGGEQAMGPVSAAPWGSASILPISWAYIAMMGGDGLRSATEHAILAANYVAHRLAPHFPVLYTGRDGRVAHECILDLRPLKAQSGVEAVDVAKRLMDYGFHAPTLSFPVPGTLMVEPTESESKYELDRFCDAMIAIREEIARIERGEWPKGDNTLKHAPHTAEAVTAAEWTHPYSRQEAAFPTAHVRAFKFWPPIARINDAYGDRNVVCACPPMEAWTRG